MNIVLLVFVTIVLAVFLFYSLKGGVPESVSATYYMLGKKGWLFQLFMLSMGTCLIPVWMEVSEDNHKFLVFLSCASLLFVASAPAFQLKLEGKVHYASAIICCVSAVLWQILEGLWDVTLYFGFLGMMLSLQWKDKWCWWLEWAVIGSILANLWRLV